MRTKIVIVSLSPSRQWPSCLKQFVVEDLTYQLSTDAEISTFHRILTLHHACFLPEFFLFSSISAFHRGLLRGVARRDAAACLSLCVSRANKGDNDQLMRNAWCRRHDCRYYNSCSTALLLVNSLYQHLPRFFLGYNNGALENTVLSEKCVNKKRHIVDCLRICWSTEV